MSQHKQFSQDPPTLHNQFTSDVFLQAYLKYLVPADLYQTVFEPDLTQLGEQVAGVLLRESRAMEQNHPKLERFDAWGNRVDTIKLSREWHNQHDVSAREGLIAIAYERKYGQYSRVLQMSKLYLYNPSSGMFGCPLAMTDGAARLCELLTEDRRIDSKLSLPVVSQQPIREAYGHLTSRSPARFWTSGQWMTERGGGSDVGIGTRTTATLNVDGTYSLKGLKWFTSATDSDVAMTLARIVDPTTGKTTPGSRGLSCFYVRIRDEVTGRLNNIKIQRLKQKLGTRALPTAELELHGTRAFLISTPGRGVATIVTLVNITRLHNSITAVANMRRMLALMEDYAGKRSVFGKLLTQQPLHVETMADLHVEFRAGVVLVFSLVSLLGRLETNDPSLQQDDRHLFRLLTPIAKLFTAKQSVRVLSEGVESFGGAGYVENTDLPRMLRDNQVLTIWEGTTNVLALDVVRVLRKSQGEAYNAFARLMSAKLARVLEMLPVSKAATREVVETVCEQLAKLTSFVELAGVHPKQLEIEARRLAFSIANIYCATLLLEFAVATEISSDWTIAQRWIRERTLVSVRLQAGLDNAARFEASQQVAIASKL